MLRLAEAEAGVPIPCSLLAREGKMPERFLLQVMRSLVNQGLLHSIRGVDGGYYLARPADQITLCNIVEAFDNPLESKLPEVNSTSPQVRDRVMETLKRASQAARHELERLTLAELLPSQDEELTRKKVVC